VRERKESLSQKEKLKNKKISLSFKKFKKDYHLQEVKFISVANRYAWKKIG